MRAVSRTILCVAALAAAAATAPAGSIWDKANPKTRAIHADDTAKDRGDSITVVISEKTTIETDTSRNLEKKDDRSAEMSGTFDPEDLFKVTPGFSLFTFPTLEFLSAGSSKFEGDSEYESDNSLIDEVTVTVQDVLPNGNLVVAGTRIREVDGDKQTIEVSGIVRPSDVTFDNTVSSTKVANFRIVYSGKGSEKQWTKPGWLGRLMDLFNPF
jgi:flagellar L-ring protein precursor FlgH